MDSCSFSLLKKLKIIIKGVLSGAIEKNPISLSIALLKSMNHGLMNKQISLIFEIKLTKKMSKKLHGCMAQWFLKTYFLFLLAVLPKLECHNDNGKNTTAFRIETKTSWVIFRV